MKKPGATLRQSGLYHRHRSAQSFPCVAPQREMWPTVALDVSELFVRDEERLRSGFRYMHAFPKPRSPTLPLPYLTKVTLFWRLLSNAFPLLTYLVPIGKIRAIAEHESK